MPEPKVLEKRCLEVFNKYHHIICAKSGKALFATKDAMAIHKSTLKHIRRNCVSDIPLVSYYSPSHEDKDGLMIYQCHRGTNGNEGLHQKLRQLIRGFSNSPRLVFAMLTDFFDMWNVNIDIRLRGVDEKYYGLFDGDVLEEEMEKMSRWPNRDLPPHPDWVSTRYVEDNHEAFGFIDPVPSRAVNDDDSASDNSLNQLADNAANELRELDAEIGNENRSSIAPMPPSSQWLAALHGRARGSNKVMGHFEWEYFKTNILNFRGGVSEEADNYTGYRFSDFAVSWNAWVDALGSSKPEVTYKTAAYLQEAYKQMKRRGVQDSTLRQHSSELDRLRDNHTSTVRNQAFGPEFSSPVAAAVARPAARSPPRPSGAAAAGDALNAEASNAAVECGGDTEDPNDTRTPYQVVVSEGRSRRRWKRGKKQSRCRRCGHEYASEYWKVYHEHGRSHEEGPRGHFVPNATDTKVWNTCTVPDNLICKLFQRFDYKDPAKRLPRKRCNGCPGCYQ